LLSLGSAIPTVKRSVSSQPDVLELGDLTSEDVEVLLFDLFPLCRGYWRQHDIIGVSLKNILRSNNPKIEFANTYRFEIDTILTDGKINDLLAKLREFLTKKIPLSVLPHRQVRL